MAKGPCLPNLDMLRQMGIDPKTGLPVKLSLGNRTSTKADIKKALRKHDEQLAVNRYTWYNLPSNITGQELEKYIYYYGQLAFWYMPELNQFFFSKYALDGNLDFYGRYQKIHPIPINSGGSDEKYIKAQEKVLSEYKLNCVYDVKLPEELDEETLTKSAVLLYDYSKQLPQMIIPTQLINEPIIDLEAECMPFLRTALLLGTGTKGIRVPDEDAADEVDTANRELINGALDANPYVPITSKIEFQELTDGTVSKASEYLQSMQAIDNFRIGLHGVPNGGLFEKTQYVNNAQTNINLGGADVSLTLIDGLKIRQDFCNKVNSIWGLGIWCEPSETIVNMDLNNDGTAYDREVDGGNENDSE